MLKKLLIACLGTAVVLAAGVAFAGVPCAGTSECNVSTNSPDCTTTEGAFCPQGDGDVVTVAVVIRDCYGNTLAGRDVTIAPPGGNFFFCEAAKVVQTDALGEASTTFAQFGGCGFAQFSATSEGVTIQGNLIYSSSFDNDSPATGDVGLSDFARFSSHFGSANACSDYDCDGTVGLGDFAKFSSHFGHT
jgi:hypothetical protein